MTAKADIRERVDAFVSDLENLIREAIRTRFDAALGDAPAPARRRGRAPRRAKANAAPRAGAKPASSRRAPKLAGKRSPEALAKLEASLVALIRRKPGKRTEEINAALGTTTREVFGPIAKLLQKKLIKKTGRKRSTKYFPAGK